LAAPDGRPATKLFDQLIKPGHQQGDVGICHRRLRALGCSAYGGFTAFFQPQHWSTAYSVQKLRQVMIRPNIHHKKIPDALTRSGA
jgi:hypothetical protein